MKWFLWGLILLAQNAAFTWVSRARNSSNVKYHAIAATASNGVWFVSQFFVIDILSRAKTEPALALTAGVFYTTLTVIASVSMHKFLMAKVERGTRKVG